MKTDEIKVTFQPSGRTVFVLPGTKIVEKGAEGDAFYVIVSGQAAVIKHDREFKTYSAYDYFGETRTVDVHVRQLRTKLEGVPIETAWGVGYRMEDGA